MTIEYTFVKDSSCVSCRAENVPLAEFDFSPLGQRGERLVKICELCASTMTSTYGLQYPEQHNGDSIEVMRTVCFVGNQILKALQR